MKKWADSIAKMDRSHLYNQNLNLRIRLSLYAQVVLFPQNTTRFPQIELADIKYGKAPGAALLPKLTSQTGCCNVCENSGQLITALLYHSLIA